jgi:Xaa-Pro aminopeptidase
MSTPVTADDDAELRAARRDRVFDAMAIAGLDVLVLGRRDSVGYATGSRSLWTAGTRPFGPACVLVGSPRSTHLLSSWDEGVPPEVPFGHLYGVTWNPAVLTAALAAIPGIPEARRMGVEALSPGFERMATRIAARAQVVPADDLVRAVRALKLPAEVERVRAAVAIAKDGVEAAITALADGAGPATARRAALLAAAARGVTLPSSGVVVRPADSDGAPGYVDLGLLVGGYEGGLGRSLLPVGDDDARTVAAQERLLAACRPGAPAADLREAATGARWMVRGSGMGFEPPVVTDTLGRTAVIEEGMVLSVQVEVDGRSRRDLALVAAGATQAL